MSALDDAGLGPDESVTVNLHGISLRSALNHVLRQLNLTFILVDEVMLITTPVVAEELLKVCVYDVRDLIAGEQDNYRVNELIDVIESSVAPQTWTASGGGVGDIRTIHPGLLVVSQSQLVHEEIGELLLVLRQIGRQIPDNLGALSGQTARRIVTRHYLVVPEKGPADRFGVIFSCEWERIQRVPLGLWCGGGRFQRSAWQ
jgi:hypothetical protein